MWQQVSKTAHVACKEQSRAGPSAPKWTKCLWAWNKSSPTKRCFWGQCPSKVLFSLGGNFWDLLRPHGFVTLKGTPLPLQHMCCSSTLLSSAKACVVVVHSCLQLRLIRHEWGASFFDVGASLKNCSRHLQRIKSCGSFGSKANKMLAGLEQILPHTFNVV